MTAGRVVGFALAAGMVAASSAADTVADFRAKMDRFDLWNGCERVGLLVEGLPDRARKIGLREATIETTVRSRLRGARIYTDRLIAPYLYVNVNVGGPAYTVTVQFERKVMVLLPATPKGTGDLTGQAPTWQTASMGTHGGTAAFVLSSVAQDVDRFIDEYLRVNADACDAIERIRRGDTER